MALYIKSSKIEHPTTYGGLSFVANGNTGLSFDNSIATSRTIPVQEMAPTGSRPIFYVYALNTPNVYFWSGNPQKITFNTAYWDHASNWDLVNSRFTAPADGIYLFGGFALFLRVYTNYNNYGDLIPYINGSYLGTGVTGAEEYPSVCRGVMAPTAGVQTVYGVDWETTIKLNQNDYVEFWANGGRNTSPAWQHLIYGSQAKMWGYQLNATSY